MEPIKPGKQTKEYYEWFPCMEWLLETGKVSKKLEAGFWHWMVNEHQVTRDTFTEFHQSDIDEATPKIAKVIQTVINEFGEGTEFFVSW